MVNSNQWHLCLNKWSLISLLILECLCLQCWYFLVSVKLKIRNIKNYQTRICWWNSKFNVKFLLDITKQDMKRNLSYYLIMISVYCACPCNVHSIPYPTNSTVLQVIKQLIWYLANVTALRQITGPLSNHLFNEYFI